MCGRFALALDSDAIEQSVRGHYAPNVTGWRDEPRHQAPDDDVDQQAADEDAPGASTSGDIGKASPAKSPKVTKNDLRIEHGFRIGNYNIAPQTNVPVIYRAEISEGNLREPVIQSMKWGLVPHWHKKPPEKVSALKTINARDDTILSGGMWNSQRGRRRCIIVCQGFYEWLKKGNDRLPHFTQMPVVDGKRPLMCFAGLWDSVTFEGEDEPLYTFTIITTSSNKQLNFLHDRMPVILGTKEEVDIWLDVSSSTFEDKHAKLMRPYEGDLECYAVPKEVGKVQNNSPDFIKPVAERKGNITSFFANQAAKSPSRSTSKSAASPKRKREQEEADTLKKASKKTKSQVKKEDDVVLLPNSKDTEDNAPKPKDLVEDA